MKFKGGDKVEIISLAKCDCECKNWILEETKQVHLGDKFTVMATSHDGYLNLNELFLAHPEGKFRLVVNNRRNIFKE